MWRVVESRRVPTQSKLVAWNFLQPESFPLIDQSVVYAVSSALWAAAASAPALKFTPCAGP